MRTVSLSLLILSCFLQPSHALILVGHGNDPVTDHGWPSNAVTVANLKSRTGWWEGPPFGGGEWHFEYVGDTATFQQALDAFAKIDSTNLDLFIHDGGQFSFASDPNHEQTTNNLDWTFTIWVPKNWQHLYGQGHGHGFSDDPNFGKSMPPPRIDLYPDSQTKIAFEKIKVPANVKIQDERAIAAGVDVSGGTVLLATILEAGTHQPIPGARLIATARDEKNQYTKPFTNAVADEKGIASLTGLPSQVFQISATAGGFVEAAVEYGDFPAHSYKQFEVALARANSVSGTVVDESGNGIPAIRLVAANTLLATNVPYRTLTKPETVTDSEGHFTLTNLPAGLAQIWTFSTNYFSTNLFIYHPVPGPEIVIPVRRADALLLKIQDASGNSIHQWQNQQVQVTLHPAGGDVIGSYGGGGDVDTNGTHFFSGVHPGDYKISVNPSDKTSSVTVEPAKTAEAIIQLP
jgi:hypothetical protein